MDAVFISGARTANARSAPGRRIAERERPRSPREQPSTPLSALRRRQGFSTSFHEADGITKSAISL
jgi:hypothetical protein